MRGSVHKEPNGTYTVIYDAGEQQRHKCTNCSWRQWHSGRPYHRCLKCGGEVETVFQRRQHKKRGFAKKGDAETFLTAKVGEVETGGHIDPKRITVADYLNEVWLPVMEASVSPNTYKGYADDCRIHIIPAIGGKRLQQLGEPNLLPWLSELAKSGGPGGRGLRPKTRRNIYFVLHKALDDAVRWKYVVTNALKGIDAPVAHRGEMRVWTPEQMRAFARHVRHDRLFAAVMLFITTGMRRGEVMGLRWCDIDWDNRTVAIEWTLTEHRGRTLLYKRPKSNRRSKRNHSRRRVKIDRATLAALRERRKQYLEERMAAGQEWREGPADWSYELAYPDDEPDNLDLIFRAPNGDILYPKRFSDFVPEKAVEAGLPRLHMHGLRHSYATMMLSSGQHPKVVSVRIGHSVINHTLDLYSWVQEPLDEEAADAGAELLFGDETDEDEADDGSGDS